jgi:P2-related tail formation protein
MTDQPRTLIAVDAGELDSLKAEVRALRQVIESISMQARPEWMNIKDYAAHIGRTERTVRNMIARGQIETKRRGNVVMIRA